MAATYLLFPLYQRLSESVAAAGLHDRWVFIIATWLGHTLTFYAMAIPFHLCDKYGWLQQYRRPRTKGNVPNEALERKSILAQVKGHFINQIPFLWVLHELVKPYPSSINSQLPPPLQMYLYYVFCMVWHEIGFYSFHRFFHAYPTMYKKIHKVHHEFVGTTVWATEYTHLVEQLLGSIGAHLQFSEHHTMIWVIWIMWRTQDSCEHHSGYSFKGTWLHRLGLTNSDRTEFHDWHHTHPSAGNFGTHLFADFALRTNDSYMLELERQRKAVASLPSGSIERT
jgi:sterol desaturase/sphingolipid hydroxylase (fatty acid hydroxylase superfamily)